MKTILVCNQKGGVGKSLCADELAFSFERSGIPIEFYDLDEQGGTLHHTRQDANAQVAIVDTPGALQEAFSTWLQQADLVVLPVRPTSRDIEPLYRMLHSLESFPELPVCLVVNGWNRFKASTDFVSWLKDNLPSQQFCILPQSEAFVQAGAQHQSIVSAFPKSKASTSTQIFVNTIRFLLGFPPETPLETTGKKPAKSKASSPSLFQNSSPSLSEPSSITLHHETVPQQED